MKEVNTNPGKTYAVTSPNGCTVTQHVGEVDIVTNVPAGQQTLIIAHAGKFEIDDDSAIVTECGGSAELVFTAATTRAASSGTGSDGMTAEERALLMGAAQRDADNTFSAGNTFTGAVDMSGAQVTPPEGWNVGELTPEAIQQVVPIKWSESTAPTLTGYGLALGSETTATEAVCIGSSASAAKSGVTVGVRARTTGDNAVALGEWSNADESSVAVGSNALANYYGAVSVGYMTRAQKFVITAGYYAQSNKSTAITIGSQFYETTDSGNVTHTCTTEGTGSITIGAGANTLNNGDTESSNSVTIGCKAENQGADSVVIGAQAKNPGAPGGVYIGAGATTTRTENPSVAIGRNAKCGKFGVSVGVNANSTGDHSVIIGYGANSGHMLDVCLGFSSTAEGTHAVAIGSSTNAGSQFSTAIGSVSTAKAKSSTAIGARATVSDYGATVIRSTAEDGTYTQLYFSGANTPLANTYENGEAMMGYVVRDSAGNIMTDAEGNAMVGTQKLSVLFPNNRGENAFTPAMLSMDEDWTPKPMFRPSDLDMPTEEPTEPEEYQPLPVYPIVEPEIEPLTE